MADVTPSPPAPVAPSATGSLAQQLPGYDPGPVIAAAEQNLADYLNMPVQEILNRLGMRPNPETGTKQPDQGQQSEPQAGGQDAGQQASPMDPSSLISPVMEALGSLGTGIFQALNPSTLFESIESAIESASSSTSSSSSSSGSGWTGQGSNSASKATQSATKSGQQISQQSQILKTNTAQAATTVGHARTQLLAIVAQFQATLAAAFPGLPFTFPTIISAAVDAVTKSVTVVGTAQGSLAGNAAAVLAGGLPVDVTQLGSQMLSPALEVGTGLLSSGMSAATQGLGSGVSAGTGLIGQVASASKDTGTDATKTSGDDKPLSTAGGLGKSGGGGGGGGAGAVTSMQSLSPRTGVGMPSQNAGGEAAAKVASVAPRVSPSGSMGGPTGGMGMAPGAGSRAGNSNNEGGHNSAAFLHTTDQGDEIVGDLGTVAPPVIGEADPNEVQEIDLRI